jgi:MFS family permease
LTVHETRAPSVARIGLLLGILVGLTVIGSSAVAVALPQLRADLGLDTAGTGWVLAAFSLTFSVCTAIFGRLADLRGLRLPMRIGIVLFTAGSILAAAAWSFPSLVAGRLLQGAGAGAVPVLSLGIVAARFTGPARARAIGGLVAVVSLVSASGPLIGGGLAELVSWRGVLALPAMALLLGEPVARLAPAEPTARGRLDLRGALLVSVTVASLIILLQAPATRPGPLLLAGMLTVGLAGMVGLVWHIRERPTGLLPLAVVTDRSVMLGALTGWTLIAAYIGMMLALPLLLSGERGWSPLQIGLALLPAALAGAVVSRLTNVVVSRFGVRRVAVALASASCLGVLVAMALPTSPVALVAGMTFVVSAFAGGQAALLEGVTAAVDEQVRGAALGVFNVVFFTGGAFGAAAVGGLADLLSLPAALGFLAVAPAAGVLLALGLPVIEDPLQLDIDLGEPPLPT